MKHIDDLFKSSNQNKFSYVLMLPLKDKVLDNTLTNWLQERVNLVKPPVFKQEELEYMFECSDYVLCNVGPLKCVTDTKKPVFLDLYDDNYEVKNKDNIFVFDPLRNESKKNLDYTNFTEIAIECLQKDLDKHWIPYYEV
tara:strand:+ start:5917 stop:6336 length:420 start_codon:yes stop_codon:yes gene_type:complete